MATAKPAPDPSHRIDRVGIRITPRQKLVLHEAAGRSGLDVSSWLRALGLERAAALGITEQTVTVPEPKPKTAKGEKRPKAAPPPVPKTKRTARPTG